MFFSAFAIFVVLVTFSKHEEIVRDIATRIGFEHISVRFRAGFGPKSRSSKLTRGLNEHCNSQLSCVR